MVKVLYFACDIMVGDRAEPADKCRIHINTHEYEG